MTGKQLREIIGNYKIGDEPFYIVNWSDCETPVLKVSPQELKPFQEELIQYWLEKVGLVDVKRLFKSAKEKMSQFEGEEMQSSSLVPLAQRYIPLVDCFKDGNKEIQNALEGIKSQSPQAQAALAVEETETLPIDPATATVHQKQSKKSASKSNTFKKNALDRNRNFLLPCYEYKVFFNERAFKDHAVKHHSFEDQKNRCCHCGSHFLDDHELATHMPSCKSAMRCDPNLIPADKRAKRGAPKKIIE